MVVIDPTTKKDLTVMVCEIETKPISAHQAGKPAKRRGEVFWVYVVCWRQRGPCKIGMSDTPILRLGQLQTGNPYQLHVWRAYGATTAEQAYAIELKALNRLAGVRLKGEWVEATVNQASDAVISAFSSMGLAPIQHNKTAEKQRVYEEKLIRQGKWTRKAKFTDSRTYQK